MLETFPNMVEEKIFIEINKVASFDSVMLSTPNDLICHYL